MGIALGTQSGRERGDEKARGNRAAYEVRARDTNFYFRPPSYKIFSDATMQDCGAAPFHRVNRESCFNLSPHSRNIEDEINFEIESFSVLGIGGVTLSSRPSIRRARARAGARAALQCSLH